MTREQVYGFIAAEKTTYPVRLLCRVLQVSSSALVGGVLGPVHSPVAHDVLAATQRGHGSAVEERPRAGQHKRPL